MVDFGSEENKYINELNLLNKFAQFYKAHGLNSLDGPRMKAICIGLCAAGVDTGGA